MGGGGWGGGSGGRGTGDLRWDYPREFETFENLWSNSLPKSTNVFQKSSARALKVNTEFLLELQSKVSKVPSLCRSVLSNSRGK